MNKDERELLKILSALPHVTQFQVHVAYILLMINGLESSLAYVEAVSKGVQPITPLEAAEEIYFEQIERNEFFCCQVGYR